VKTEVLHGFHPVVEGLKAGRRRFLEIYVGQGKSSKRLEAVHSLACRLKVPVKQVKPDQLDAWTRTHHHQGVGAKVGAYPLADIGEIFKAASKESAPLLLFLDGILDPQNLGALMRTGLAAGIHGVITTKDRAAAPTPTVSRISAGAMEHLLFARVTNLVAAIEEAKKIGLWVVGMDPASQQLLYDIDCKVPLAVAIGAEEKGLRPLVRKHCDFLAAIPQNGPVASLNASVAGAVVLYEVLRQRVYG
jgi:23S rRNA (guanosine2251-2'-O)-methyltransferase